MNGREPLPANQVVHYDAHPNPNPNPNSNPNQVVHYDAEATFGMHHDSSAFHPRFLTAFYYLNEPDSGGETAFPAADGAMSPAEAMGLREPAAAGVGLVVTPKRGDALLFYNHDEAGAIDPLAVHAGCRVLDGEKWGANHWVRVSQPAAPADTAASQQPGAEAVRGTPPPPPPPPPEQDQECQSG